MVTRVVGADAWKKGWVAATVEDGWVVAVTAHVTIGDLVAGEPDAVAIGVDIPIGLPETPPRPADAAARSFIGARASSVFPTPPRDVLEAPSYQEALALSRKRYGIGVTAQSYALRRRILEADDAARTDDRIIEVHPEVTFRALSGAPLEFPKRSWNGQMERRRLLSEAGLSIPEHLPDQAGMVPPDDILDAVAVAWSAARFAAGEARALPAEAPLPGFGEVIWY